MFAMTTNMVITGMERTFLFTLQKKQRKITWSMMLRKVPCQKDICMMVEECLKLSWFVYAHIKGKYS